MKIIFIMLLCLLSVSLQAQNQSPPVYHNFYDYQKAFYEKQKEKSTEDLNEEQNEDGELERFQRMEWWTAPRVFPSGDWKNFSKLSLDAEVKLKNSSRSSNGRWQACGPNNINAVIEVVNGIGRVTSIEFGASGTLYVGTAQGDYGSELVAHGPVLRILFPTYLFPESLLIRLMKM